MGRLLSLACSNCVPGDASGWYLPLAAICVAGVLLGLAARRLAEGRSGLRYGVTLLAAATIAFAPGLAVAALAADAGYRDVVCGSALSASLLRGLPDDSALDDAQAGCKAAGLRRVRLVTTSAAVLVGLAALTLLAAGVPGQRRLAEA